jgi:DNA-binding MarR family transcriptional regulator
MSEDLSREAADRFHSAAIHALRYVAREDSASGLSAARLSALSVLVFGGARTLGELAAAERVRPPTMTHIVTGLERAGLVVREGDASDGRVVRVQASPKGKRVLQRARDRRVAELAERLSHLDPNQIELVRDAAELVEAALRPSSAPARPARGA